MSNKGNKINKNKDNIYKKIRNVLVITLMVIMGFVGVNLLPPNHKIDGFSFRAEALQKQAINDVAKWQNKINELKIQFSKDASINVLQGECGVNVSFTNRDTEGKGNSLSFLQKRWAEWNSKSLTVNSVYSFGFSYNMADIQVINYGSGNIKIKLSQKDLDLKYVEEQTDKTVLESKVGILSKKFTPQEISAVSNRTKIHTVNTLKNKRELRDKATEYLQEIVNDMSKQFGFKDVEIEVHPDYLLDNNEVNIINLTY